MITSRAFWQEDKDAPVCKGCRRGFTFFFRRHHCRNCGYIFCGDCTSQSIPIPGKGLMQAERVCQPCYVFLRMVEPRLPLNKVVVQVGLLGELGGKPVGSSGVQRCAKAGAHEGAKGIGKAVESPSVVASGPRGKVHGAVEGPRESHRTTVSFSLVPTGEEYRRTVVESGKESPEEKCIEPHIAISSKKAEGFLPSNSEAVTRGPTDQQCEEKVEDEEDDLEAQFQEFSPVEGEGNSIEDEEREKESKQAEKRRISEEIEEKEERENGELKNHKEGLDSDNLFFSAQESQEERGRDKNVASDGKEEGSDFCFSKEAEENGGRMSPFPKEETSQQQVEEASGEECNAVRRDNEGLEPHPKDEDALSHVPSDNNLEKDEEQNAVNNPEEDGEEEEDEEEEEPDNLREEWINIGLQHREGVFPSTPICENTDIGDLELDLGADGLEKELFPFPPYTHHNLDWQDIAPPTSSSSCCTSSSSSFSSSLLSTSSTGSSYSGKGGENEMDHCSIVKKMDESRRKTLHGKIKKGQVDDSRVEDEWQKGCSSGVPNKIRRKYNSEDGGNFRSSRIRPYSTFVFLLGIKKKVKVKKVVRKPSWEVKSRVKWNGNLYEVVYVEEKTSGVEVCHS